MAERRAHERATTPPNPANQPAPALPDRDRPVHVMFCFVDHWEPGTDDRATTMAGMWASEYVKMAGRHHDADGRHPQHTWFCLNLGPAQLSLTARACFDQFGEMEIHIHHGTPDETGRDNTEEMKALTRHYLDTLQLYGACLTAEPHPRQCFGFIHGMWALDNSRIEGNVRRYCGVNREIDLLLDAHCYGDFTFPAWGTMAPSPERASRIMLARDTPAPKSYDDPNAVRQPSAGGPRPTPQELMIFQGPGRMTNIDLNEPPTLYRMNDWVEQRVHVPGREDWIFVKVYTHSAVNLLDPKGESNLIGPVMDHFYTDIEARYNDGAHYQLHYVTTRECYNIAMAAIDGKDGNPGDYRDYVLPPPVNTRLYCSTEARLLTFDPTAGQADLEVTGKAPTLELLAHDFNLSGTVLEGETLDALHPSDALREHSAEATLILRDPTPSRYYRLTRDPANNSRDRRH